MLYFCFLFLAIVWVNVVHTKSFSSIHLVGPLENESYIRPPCFRCHSGSFFSLFVFIFAFVPFCTLLSRFVHTSHSILVLLTASLKIKKSKIDYGCALQKEILVQGRLYISENHVCFNANIFGWVTNVSAIALDLSRTTRLVQKTNE